MLRKDLVNQEKVKQLVSSIDNLPKQLTYKQESYVRLPGKASMMNYFSSLAECACGPVFDRTKSDIRKNIEDRIIQEIEKRFPINKTINYLSLGSGYLLPDYIICARLIEKGYLLRVILVDPESLPNEKGELDAVQAGFKNALAKFMELQAVAKEMGLSFSVEVYGNIMDFINKHPDDKIHAAHAIDFSAFSIGSQIDMYDDVFLLHQILDKDGFFHLSLGDQEYFYNQLEVFHFQDHKLSKWDVGLDSQTVRLQAIQVPQISKETSKFVENAVSAILPGKVLPKNVAKKVMLFTGVFKQGPVFEKIAELKKAGISLG